MRITKNFELAEITANQRNIVNIPNAEQTVSICRLVFFLLQPLRIMLNKSITITSGFRCEKLNSAVGGTSKSQHVKGEAVDINVTGMTKKELFLFILESELSFDQMIYEIDANCLHISRILTNFVYKLHIRGFVLNGFDFTKLLKINDMCNFLYIIIATF